MVHALIGRDHRYLLLGSKQPGAAYDRRQAAQHSGGHQACQPVLQRLACGSCASKLRTVLLGQH